MKTGTCPKCGSTDIFTAENLPLKGGPFGSNSIPITLTSMAALDNYICVACGLVESYVAEQNKLDEVAAKWNPVKKTNETAE